VSPPVSTTDRPATTRTTVRRCGATARPLCCAWTPRWAGDIVSAAPSFVLPKRDSEKCCTDFTVESGEPSHHCNGHNCDPFGNYNGPTGSAATAVQATIFPPGSAGGSEAWQTGDWDTTAWFAFQVGGRPWTATRGQTFAESEGCSAGCTDGQSGCGSWARMGECENNPSWMTTRCSHSCNTCWSDAECREQVPGSSYRYFPGDSTPATYA